MLYLFIALIVVTLVMGGVIVALILLHYKEKEELFKKFMAKNFNEYNYFKHEFPNSIKAEKEKKRLDTEREKKITPAEKLSTEKAEQF